MSTRSLVRTAGLLVWAFAGVPAAISIARHPRIGAGAIAAWLGAFLVFGFAFFRASRHETTKTSSATVSLVGVQTVAALAMNVVLCTGFEVALLVVVAVQLGLTLRLRHALGWLAAQSIVAVALAVHHMGLRFGGYWSIAVVGAQAFALTVAFMAASEAAARRALERINTELQASRESLARASRDAERLRIARELHDLLGHDLVALHLELETARHLPDAKVRVHLERAHEVARGLLADVRKAVSSLREDDDKDIVGDVRAIVSRVHEPRVHLDMPEALAVREAERANAVVRCVQEIVTNSIKHAAADNLWIAIVPHRGFLELTARDDGRGGAAPNPGNGLAGMRERMEKLGGELVLETQPGRGFSVRAKLPVPETDRA